MCISCYWLYSIHFIWSIGLSTIVCIGIQLRHISTNFIACATLIPFISWLKLCWFIGSDSRAPSHPMVNQASSDITENRNGEWQAATNLFAQRLHILLKHVKTRDTIYVSWLNECCFCVAPCRFRSCSLLFTETVLLWSIPRKKDQSNTTTPELWTGCLIRYIFINHNRGPP